jgi:DNA-dependent RNA polymerase auxiliary subunit epsilon
MNCQAKACALYVSLVKKKEIEACINDRNYFKRIVSQLEKQNTYDKSSQQFEIKFN